MSHLWAFVMVVSVVPVAADDGAVLLQSVVEFRSGLNVTKSDEQVVSTPIQKSNADAEDELARKIWVTLLEAPGSRCDGMYTLAKNYAADTTLWVKDDRLNPEFGALDDPVEEAAKLRDTNQALTTYRQKLRALTSQQQPNCATVAHLLGCPVSSVRFLAPYEFVFKSGKKWVAKKRTNTIDPDGTEPENKAARAYYKARCLPGASHCDKETPDPKLQRMFRFKKGRGAPGNRFTTGNAGIAELPWLQGRAQESVYRFWVAARNVHVGDTTESCKQQQELAHCARCGNSQSCSEDFKELCDDLKKICEAIDQERDQDKKIVKGMHMPAEAENVADTAKEVMMHFKNCGVPWVGGVSGSALEMFAFYEWKNPEQINDAMLLQWMALYTLNGFHSLGEVWSAMHPFMVSLGYTAPQVKLMRVTPPLTMDGCKGGNGAEKKFLDQLRSVFGLDG